ncbi:DNA primase [Pediococcus cellicola]|uniref:DNA primase n=1 Tax=Pediococcus cellicola TaxID=319652 RepID=A0A0R2J081_9LACO|nr:DNA primase [Pediococcus cellicola]
MHLRGGNRFLARPIPEDLIDQIRTSVDIVDVIGQYVQLKKQGKNFFGLCPFHEERTASFSVSESKQIFHCFSCGRGGNVFKFLMELNHVEFPVAVRQMADFASIKIPDEYSESAQNANSQNSEQAQLISLYDQTAQLYTHVLLNTKMGQQALEYLHQRGLTDDIIEKFQLGFAPGEQLLKEFFDEKKVDYQVLRKSGLFIEDQQGQLRDRFRGRVMYAIKNPQGHVIAFSGRILNKADSQAKYINSPETKIFSKSNVLYNFDIARTAIRQEKRAILFEGFMDVIAAYQSGVTNGIASMGTSFTNEQIYLLQRTTTQLDICYDGDDPGQAAINRAIDAFSQNSQLKLSVIEIPEKLDPDEFVRQHGGKQFNEIVHSARLTPTAFKLDYLKRDFNLNNEADQLTYIERALKVIGQLGSSVEQDLYLNQLAQEFNVQVADLRQQLRQIRSQQSVDAHQQAKREPLVDKPQDFHRQKVKLDKVELAEQRLLNYLLYDHNVWLKLAGLPNFHFVHEEYQTIYMLATGYFENHNSYDSAAFMDFVHDTKLQNIIAELDLQDLDDANVDQSVSDYIDVITAQAPLSQQISEKTKSLNEAKKMGNTELQQKLAVELVELYRQRQGA